MNMQHPPLLGHYVLNTGKKTFVPVQLQRNGNTPDVRVNKELNRLLDTNVKVSKSNLSTNNKPGKDLLMADGS